MPIGYTPYSQKRRDFSDRGQLKAQSTIYPLFFGKSQDQLDFESIDDKKAEDMDREEGCDKRVRVTVAGLVDKLAFDFQYRFREPRYIDYQDITMTEWNYKSNLPSELYKIRAHLFLYGYYDIATDRILEAMIFHVSPVLVQIAQGKMAYRRKTNDKEQSFITISFEELSRSGAVAFHMRGDTIL
jgi:hypothetical protein